MNQVYASANVTNGLRVGGALAISVFSFAATIIGPISGYGTLQCLLLL